MVSNLQKIKRIELIESFIEKYKEFFKIFLTETIRLKIKEEFLKFKKLTEATVDSFLINYIILAQKGHPPINFKKDKEAKYLIAFLTVILKEKQFKKTLLSELVTKFVTFLKNKSGYIILKNSIEKISDNIEVNIDKLILKSIKSASDDKFKKQLNFFETIKTGENKLYVSFFNANTSIAINNFTFDNVLKNSSTKNTESKLKLLSDDSSKINVIQFKKIDDVTRHLTNDIIKRVFDKFNSNINKYKNYLGITSVINFPKSTAVKTIPLKSTALKSTAVKTIPLKSTAVKSTAVKTTALKTTPLKSSSIAKPFIKRKSNSIHIRKIDGKLVYPLEEVKHNEERFVTNLRLILELVNQKGFSIVKVNSNTLMKYYKIKEIMEEKKSMEILNKMKNDIKMIDLINSFTGFFGVFMKSEEGIVSIYFPKFFLEKENLQENIDKLFEIILKNEKLKSKKPTIMQAKLLVSKFFGRINKDDKGKVIFSNIIDSFTKLGIVFLLPHLLMKLKPEPSLLFPKIEYFVNFMVDNLSTIVTENCRLNPLHRDLLENVNQCKPEKLVSECPVQKTCPEPSCHECPSPNFTIPIAVISVVILVGVLIILLTRKKAKK